MRRATSMDLRCKPRQWAWQTACKSAQRTAPPTASPPCYRVDRATRLDTLDLEPLAIFSRDEILRHRVTDDGFLLRIPSQFAVQPCGDTREMAGRKCAMVTEDVRDRFLLVPSSLEEVAKMIDQRTSFVRRFQRAIGQWI